MPDHPQFKGCKQTIDMKNEKYKNTEFSRLRRQQDNNKVTNFEGETVQQKAKQLAQIETEGYKEIDLVLITVKVGSSKQYPFQKIPQPEWQQKILSAVPMMLPSNHHWSSF